jgi:tetratricopeptide (TPR) repeat protein
MTGGRQAVTRVRMATSKFLLAWNREMARDDVVEPLPRDDDDSLVAAFPDMLAPRELSLYAGRHFESDSRFGALVFHLDERAASVPGEGDRELPQDLMAAARILEGFSGSRFRGAWGHLGMNALGLLMADADEDAALGLAREIGDRFQTATGHTLTAGAALYPTLDYGADTILDNAVKALAHACFFDPGSVVLFDAVSLNISGDRYYQEERIDDAVSEFESALRLDPQNANVHNSLGVCHGVRGAYDAALKAFETAAALAPEEAMMVYNIGLIHSLKGEHEKALSRYREAEAMTDDLYELLFEAGKTCLSLQRVTEALERFQRAASLRPAEAPLFRFMGESLNRLDRKKEALQAFQKAVRLNPNDAVALSFLGGLFEETGENVDIAEIFMLQSVDIQPSNARFRLRLGRFYLNQERFEEARTHLVAARELGEQAADDLLKAMAEKSETQKCDLARTG